MTAVGMFAKMHDQPLFQTNDGRVLYKAETDRHHILWRRAWYTSSYEKRIRESSGFVLRMSVVAHRDLHANVEPPQKPNHHLLRGLHQYSRELDIHDPYQKFYAMAEFLGKIASKDGPNANEASLLQDNFQQQIAFVESGKLQPYEDRNDTI